MYIRKTIKSAYAMRLAAIVLLAACLLAGQAAGEGPVNTLAVTGAEVPSLEVSLYRVATGFGPFQMAPAFSGAGVSLDDISTTAQMTEAAEKLLAAAEGLSPDASAVTDEAGDAHFSGLENGVYLVVIPETVYQNEVYAFQPLVVQVPLPSGTGPVYDVTAVVKKEKKPEEMDLTIIKSWAEGRTDKIPESITVTILCDGEPYGDPITLTAADGWKATISVHRADAGVVHEWTVREDPVPTGYTVEYARENDVCTITNTPKTPPPPAPQTGLLIWPVLLLAGVGVALIMAGVILNRKMRTEGK